MNLQGHGTRNPNDTMQGHKSSLCAEISIATWKQKRCHHPWVSWGPPPEPSHPSWHHGLSSPRCLTPGSTGLRLDAYTAKPKHYVGLNPHFYSCTMKNSNEKSTKKQNTQQPFERAVIRLLEIKFPQILLDYSGIDSGVPLAQSATQKSTLLGNPPACRARNPRWEWLGLLRFAPSSLAYNCQRTSIK